MSAERRGSPCARQDFRTKLTKQSPLSHVWFCLPTLPLFAWTPLRKANTQKSSSLMRCVRWNSAKCKSPATSPGAPARTVPRNWLHSKAITQTWFCASTPPVCTSTGEGSTRRGCVVCGDQGSRWTSWTSRVRRNHSHQWAKVSQLHGLAMPEGWGRGWAGRKGAALPENTDLPPPGRRILWRESNTPGGRWEDDGGRPSAPPGASLATLFSISEFADCWTNFVNSQSPFWPWNNLEKNSRCIQRRLQRIKEVRQVPPPTSSHSFCRIRPPAAGLPATGPPPSSWLEPLVFILPLALCSLIFCSLPQEPPRCRLSLRRPPCLSVPFFP